MINIINLLQTGCFPDNLKISKIVPIYKGDDKTLVNNYIHISVLPVFSKIHEKLIFARIRNVVVQNNILSDNQFGFTHNLSTYMALLKLTDTISKELNNKQYSIGIFLDFSKAFDTINHDILVDKLNYYGIRGTALHLIKNVVTNTVQFVNLNDVKSEYLPINCEVPPGSILGPLLFLLYINDISNISSIIDIILFADDTYIFLAINVWLSWRAE